MQIKELECVNENNGFLYSEKNTKQYMLTC